MASRPSFVVTSATTATVSVPVADRISPAARSRISRRQRQRALRLRRQGRSHSSCPNPCSPHRQLPCGPEGQNPSFSSPDCVARLAARADAPHLLIAWQSHAGRLRSPHAKAGRFKAELPRPVGRLVLDFVNTNGIFEHHAVGSFEVEEPRAGSRMAARPENNRHAALAQKIKRSQHIVVGLHLMVNVLNACMRRTHQRNRMVDRITRIRGMSPIRSLTRALQT